MTHIYKDGMHWHDTCCTITRAGISVRMIDVYLHDTTSASTSTDQYYTL